MKQIKAAVIGCGDRGKIYADYSLKYPDELKITAVVDTSASRLAAAQQRYGAEYAFLSLDEFLAADVKCDMVINATLDAFHFESSMALLKRGYNVLLEKPVTANESELLQIQQTVHETGAKLLVCHVLRYTPFYRRAKELINGGSLGRVRSIQTDEHDKTAHFLDSYVRGQWSSEKECGSGLLLAKSCHDIDLICWLNDAAAPKSVFSFGTREEFLPENAPDGAAERCTDCSLRATCPYSATAIYLGSEYSTGHTWADMDSGSDKLQYLKTSPYGRCAYKTGGDIVDNQTVVISFENGSICTHSLIGSCAKGGRRLHIVCEYGTISGFFEENRLEVCCFGSNDGRFSTQTEYIDVTAESVGKGKHSGGDENLVHDALRYFAGEEKSISITDIDGTVPGHMCVYAAEKSRRTNTVVTV